MPRLGLYLHVPFCSSICHYCNFNRGLLDADLKARYVQALVHEIHRAGAQVASGTHPATAGLAPGAMAGGGRDRRPSAMATTATPEAPDLSPAGPPAADTIYFGGGTPSLLEPDEIAEITRACREVFAVSEDAEVTLEANPETVTPERMAGYRAAGVNRVSLGVQSFRDEELRKLGRVHSAARAVEALAAVRDAGIDNVSLDLMMWLPGQSVAQSEESVSALIDLRPDHASLYLLELYPNAPLREDMARSGWTLAPDDDAAEMYERAIARLEAAGYEHYEISNAARPGRRSCHNMKYWTDAEWLGLGCGAHSTLAGIRWKNVSATGDYVARIEGEGPVATEIRVLTPAQRLEERLFMGLRLIEGIDLDEINRHYAVDVWERYADRLADHVEAGLLARERGRLRLTRRGLLLSNEVMEVFITPTVR
jgi:oxygen-independent coproporphyrinogen-3 oxidase